MLSRSELLKFFHAECRARYKSIGFARKRSGYWRIKNDLLQTFTLQFSRDGREGRVSFGVYPLCMNITEPDDHGLYYLHEFSLECRIRHKWSFDKTECNTVSECLLPVFQMIDSDLMPFFEKAIDCSSAFAETLRIEYVFESNRKEYLRLGNIVDMADPFEVRILWDPARFYMALRLHNYEWARKHLYLRLQSSEDALKRASMTESEDVRWKSEYCDRLKSSIEKIEFYLSYLKTENIPMIDDFLNRQEKETIRHLTKKK